MQHPHHHTSVSPVGGSVIVPTGSSVRGQTAHRECCDGVDLSDAFSFTKVYGYLSDSNLGDDETLSIDLNLVHAGAARQIFTPNDGLERRVGGGGGR